MLCFLVLPLVLIDASEISSKALSGPSFRGLDFRDLIPQTRWRCRCWLLAAAVFQSHAHSRCCSSSFTPSYSVGLPAPSPSCLASAHACNAAAPDAPIAGTNLLAKIPTARACTRYRSAAAHCRVLLLPRSAILSILPLDSFVSFVCILFLITLI